MRYIITKWLPRYCHFANRCQQILIGSGHKCGECTLLYPALPLRNSRGIWQNMNAETLRHPLDKNRDVSTTIDWIIMYCISNSINIICQLSVTKGCMQVFRPTCLFSHINVNKQFLFWSFGRIKSFYMKSLYFETRQPNAQHVIYTATRQAQHQFTMNT